MANFRTFTDGDDGYSVRFEQAYELHFLGGNDRLVVTAGTTTAWMGRGNDLARVEGGSAILYGESGDDRFDLHSTATVSGGSGSDLINVRGGSGHWLNAGSGDDRVNFVADTSDVRVNGSYGNDTFVGYSHAISGRIAGADGDDRFLLFGDYGGHSLRLDGGTGNDLYRIDGAAPPAIIERLGEGIDTVQIGRGVDYALGANVENLTVLPSGSTGSDSPLLMGNDLSNRITGSSGLERIGGGAGNDVIDGGAGADGIGGDDGDDLIIGGPGGDAVTGGAGSDTFLFRSTADTPYDDLWIDVDWIIDFDTSDRIDVSAIDANSDRAGFQHFRVVEGEGHAQGTLHIEGDAAGWGWMIVSGYVDADARPDFFFLMVNNDYSYPDIHAGNFII